MKQEARWRAAASSVTGTSHIRAGSGCQDAAVVRVFLDRAGQEVLVAVVSDGAGNAARAEAGSLLTCSTVAEAVEVFLSQGGAVAGLDVGTVCSWLVMVQQAIRGRAEDEGAAPKDYACTLITAIVAYEACAIFQIGDGAAVVSNTDGWCWVHWPQHGEYSNTTFFVTDDGAEHNLAFDVCPVRIDEIAMFTDGIENLVLQKATKTVFAPFFNGIMPAIRALEAPGLDAALSDSLGRYLASSAICERTDDDKTLLLATRLGGAHLKQSGELAFA